jgi:hypothetical protein
MTLPPLRTRHTLGLTLLAGALGGCSSSEEPYVDPAKELGTTERQREWDRTLDQPFGFMEAPFVKSSHVFEDLSDTISGSPSRYALMMNDTTSPDARRKGLLELVERPYGGKPPYTERYVQIATETGPGGAMTDSLLRASAIRGLNRSREAGHTDLFIKGLSDNSDWVRLESAKALNRLPDVAAVPALLGIAGRLDENKDVRIAATEALQHYKRLDVARVLVGMLSDRDFGIAWQANKSLSRLSGQNLGYDDKAWLAYLTGPAKPLE